MVKLSALVLAALAFWFVMFSPWVDLGVNFWLLMFSATAILGGLAIHHWVRYPSRPADRLKPAHIVIGLLAAALLYFIFWAGEQLATHVLHTARDQIDGIYSTKAQARLGPSGCCSSFGSARRRNCSGAGTSSAS